MGNRVFISLKQWTGIWRLQQLKRFQNILTWPPATIAPKRCSRQHFRLSLRCSLSWKHSDWSKQKKRSIPYFGHINYTKLFLSKKPQQQQKPKIKHQQIKLLKKRLYSLFSCKFKKNPNNYKITTSFHINQTQTHSFQHYQSHTTSPHLPGVHRARHSAWIKLFMQADRTIDI